MVAPLALGAVRLRRRLLPDWTGAPAALAVTVMVLAGLLLVGTVAGSVGLLGRGAVVLGCLGLALGAAAFGRPPSPGGDVPAPADRTGPGRWEVAVAGVAAAVGCTRGRPW